MIILQYTNMLTYADLEGVNERPFQDRACTFGPMKVSSRYLLIKKAPMWGWQRTIKNQKASHSQKDTFASVCQGYVKWFSLDKGYGFISCANDKKDYFVHHTGIDDPIRYLVAGEWVEFKIKRLSAGRKAVCVHSCKKKSDHLDLDKEK